MPFPLFTDEEITAERGPKNSLDPYRPYHWFIESEVSRFGVLEDVAVVLLANRECPFRCLMCDLWRNTLDVRVPKHAITRQIDFALGQLPAGRHIKLYNSGNFFDAQAIPPDEFPQIALRLNGMQTIIVENHPRLCNDSCTRFRDLLPASAELEIALGLETVHTDVLQRLNKHMTVDDFARAVAFLRERNIQTRAFILLKPPFLSEQEGIDWALRSLDFAFATGVRCCSIIPTRAGNGMLNKLEQQGCFSPPKLKSLETVLETALSRGRGRVFADLWQIPRAGSCPNCYAARRQRIETMNQTQQIPDIVSCPCRGSHDRD